jgi:prepilin-type N-terminal cleavage/methylation domain-containing protein
MTCRSRSGFTLVETSIVLVVVALIIGGIYVGSDLIRAASLRSQVLQIEYVDAAVNLFRNKFNCLPGDCPNASDFGFSSQKYNGCGSTAYTNGDGNGIIGTNPLSLTTATSYPGLEIMMFWNHLIEANVIKGQNTYSCTYGAATNLKYGIAAKAGSNPMLGIGYSGSAPGGFGYFAGDSKHYYFLSTSTTGSFWSGASYTGESMTSVEAYYIDSKIDDGLPGQGRIMAFSGGNGNVLVNWPLGSFDGVTTPNRCTEPGNGAYANFQQNSRASCALRIRAMF